MRPPNYVGFSWGFRVVVVQYNIFQGIIFYILWTNLFSLFFFFGGGFSCLATTPTSTAAAAAMQTLSSTTLATGCFFFLSPWFLRKEGAIVWILNNVTCGGEN